jgi:hypothetical protein
MASAGQFLVSLDNSLVLTRCGFKRAADDRSVTACGQARLLDDTGQHPNAHA